MILHINNQVGYNNWKGNVWDNEAPSPWSGDCWPDNNYSDSWIDSSP
jgi:hypothetical protein